MADLAPHDRVTYVGITDFNNQRYTTKVDNDPDFQANMIERALKIVRNKIVRSEPIDCEIVHPSNNARVTVIFMGPVRIDAAK